MSVNSKMTAIANAARALDGSTAALTLDGIASKLGVEKSNVTAALAAIAEKGVTVPSGSTSDALAALIASIEAGGGVKFASGKYTPASASTSATIEHGLGIVPKLFLLTVVYGYYSLVNVETYQMLCVDSVAFPSLFWRHNQQVYVKNDTLYVETSSYASDLFNFDENKVTLHANGYDTYAHFKNVEYAWIAIGW